MAIGVSDIINLVNAFLNQTEMVNEFKNLHINLQKKVHIIKIILENFEEKLTSNVGLMIAIQEIRNTIEECTAFEKKARVTDLEDETKRLVQIAGIIKEHDKLSKKMDDGIASLSIALGLDLLNKQEEPQNEILMNIEHIKRDSYLFNESVQLYLESIRGDIKHIASEDAEQLKILHSLNATISEMNEKIDSMKIDREKNMKEKFTDERDAEQILKEAHAFLSRIQKTSLSKEDKSIAIHIAEFQSLLTECEEQIEILGEDTIDRASVNALQAKKEAIEGELQSAQARPVFHLGVASAKGPDSVAERNVYGEHKPSYPVDDLIKLATAMPDRDFALDGAEASGPRSKASFTSSSFPRQQSPTRSPDALLSHKKSEKGCLEPAAPKKSEGVYQGPSLLKN